MKLVIYRSDGPPVEIAAERVRIMCNRDHFEIREQDPGRGLLVRLEEHDDKLATDLAVFPNGGNSVRLKGGLR
jgi:hypothetical protein